MLRLRNRFVVPGPAFRGVQVQHLEAQGGSDEEEGEAALTQNMPLPEGISSRVRNLFLMNLDLHGKLDEWLSEGALAASNEQELPKLQAAFSRAKF